MYPEDGLGSATGDKDGRRERKTLKAERSSAKHDKITIDDGSGGVSDILEFIVV